MGDQPIAGQNTTQKKILCTITTTLREVQT